MIYDKSEIVARMRAGQFDGTGRRPSAEMSDAYTAFSEMVNGGLDSDPAASFVMAMINDHRTLQQGVVKLLVEVITTYAAVSDRDFVGRDDTVGFDLRNDAAVKLCRQLAELADDHHLPVI